MMTRSRKKIKKKERRKRSRFQQKTVKRKKRRKPRMRRKVTKKRRRKTKNRKRRVSHQHLNQDVGHVDRLVKKRKQNLQRVHQDRADALVIHRLLPSLKPNRRTAR